MFFLVLVNVISVFYFFIRELKIQFVHIQKKKEIMTKIGIIYLCFNFLTLVFLLKFNQRTMYFLISISPIFLLRVIKISILKYDKSRFHKEFQGFLKGVALSMRVGNSFRYSVKDSYYLLSYKSKLRVERIMEFVVFTQHKKLDLISAFEHEIYAEFSKIEASSHQSLQRIDLWISNIEKKSDFRHKSVQILYQLYIQAGILSLMFFALLIFVAQNYGLMNNTKIIFSSLFLFTVGLTLCFKIGKKIKWNF